MGKAEHKAQRSLVTVLLPCYNGLPYLHEALQSIREQSYSNLEILCIDDGSTDESLTYLLEQSAIDDRIKVIENQENIGLIRTLNKSVPLAKGDYIARIDADDIVEKDWISLCLSHLTSNPSLDFVCPQNVNITESGKLINRNIMRAKNVEANFFASFFFTPFSHGGMVCTTKLLMENLYLTENKAVHTEDYELFARLLRSGYKMINIPEYLYRIRINYSSVSRTYTDLQDANYLSCASDHYYNYSGKRLVEPTQKVFNNRISADFSMKELLEALKELKSFKQFFIKKENIKDREKLKEIESVYKTHRLDILIQSLKRGRFTLKIPLFFLLLSAIVMSLFNSVSRRYLLSKF